MKKKTHIYDITMSNGETFRNVRIKGPIEQKYSTIAEVFIKAENDAGRAVELCKYQLVKAELMSVGD